ncbi:hypothetical protein JJE73_30785 [Comamonas sp. JC664]|nr:hypothetical protein [Comamonas sp. JC664]
MPPAHFALAQRERWQEHRGLTFTLVTQRVDALHEQAGSRALINVHALRRSNGPRELHLVPA